MTGQAENALRLTKIAVLGVFIAYGLRRIVAEPTQAADSFTPFFPLGAGGVLVAMGLTFIAFEGYDLIATVAEEIKNPEKNIPRAERWIDKTLARADGALDAEKRLIEAKTVAGGWRWPADTTIWS